MRLTWPTMTGTDLEFATRAELCDAARWLGRPLTDPERATFMAAPTALIESRVADYREACEVHAASIAKCLALVDPYRRGENGPVDRSAIPPDVAVALEAALAAMVDADPNIRAVHLADVVRDPFEPGMELTLEIKPDPEPPDTAP